MNPDSADEYKLLAARFLSSRLFFALFLALLLPGFATGAERLQDMQALEQEAAAWMSEQLAETPEHQISIRTPDASLRLPACPEPLAFTVHGKEALRGRVNIKVNCYAADWFIFISAEVQVFAPVVVARTHLARGIRLNPSQLVLEKRDVSTIRGHYFSDLNALADMETKSRVRAGRVLTSRHVEVRQAVTKGDQVVILARSDRLQIRMLGEALEDGRLGEQIRVRNLQSGRSLRARVAGRGQVEVQL